jgi:hypothetical protein
MLLKICRVNDFEIPGLNLPPFEGSRVLPKVIILGINGSIEISQEKEENESQKAPRTAFEGFEHNNSGTDVFTKVPKKVKYKLGGVRGYQTKKFRLY